jgi:Amt family ammonium transporter
MHFTPGLRLRVDEDSEILGIDDAEMGEYAYDYVGLETELPPGGDQDLATGGGRELELHTHLEKDGSTESA